ncbi:glycosyltransferase family 39 protein [Candidatus Methylomirabilis sp.]|uniref:ArnT family glycosyltransferase n=1 Tax=Candidatus Methylomirabilis sp. TaxID=2032687 RepID=UPI0030767068
MQMLWAVLVLISWLALLWLTVRALGCYMRADWRLIVLSAYAVCGVLVWLSSELLSVFHQLTFWGIAAFWSICALIFGAIVATRPASPHLAAPPVANIRFSVSLLLPLLCSAAAISILLLTAFVAAPNNWDSMTYHLPRVMHWQQNRSLQFFPTHIHRQLHSGPWAEMAILHFQLLAGSDRLANLVQWFAMIGSVLGVSYIAKTVGGSKEAQALAVLIAVTIPMGILQSTSTQTDYVVALWVVSFTAFSLTMITEGPSLGLALLTGAGLGLAMLTKATAVLFTVPVVVWVGADLLRRRRAAAKKFAVVIVAVALAINAGHFTRNSRLYGVGSPMGPMAESPDGVSLKYTNDTYTAATLVSNLLRNSALHFGTPFRGINAAVYTVVLQIHRRIGLDVNDPRTTWTGENFRIKFSAHEDVAGNPLHFTLFGLSLLLVLRYGGRKAAVLGVCLMISFVLFSLLLKWTPWHSRLHLPFFVLSAAFAAVVVTKTFHDRLISLLMIALTVVSLPYLAYNSTRPLIGANSVLSSKRDSQYFRNRPELALSYDRVAALVKESQCTHVGLMIGDDDWEYPLWVMTGASEGRILLKHIAVDNVSGRIPSHFTPCAVIVTAPRPGEELVYDDSHTTYTKAFDGGSVVLYFSRRDSTL